MVKKFEKFWSGSVSFVATETFKDVDTAVQASVPSTAAKIVIDDKTITYDFNRIKEVKTDGDNTLRTPGKQNPGGGERTKKAERKDK